MVKIILILSDNLIIRSLLLVGSFSNFKALRGVTKMNKIYDEYD